MEKVAKCISISRKTIQEVNDFTIADNRASFSKSVEVLIQKGLNSKVDDTRGK